MSPAGLVLGYSGLGSSRSVVDVLTPELTAILTKNAGRREPGASQSRTEVTDEGPFLAARCRARERREENWTFLKLLLETEAMRGRRLVVTTTNKTALERFVGPTDAIEIFGKPYDLDLVRRTVRSSVF